MPYKSQAQQRKFHALLAAGKISKQTVDEFDKSSEGLKLPERVERIRKDTQLHFGKRK